MAISCFSANYKDAFDFLMNILQEIIIFTMTWEHKHAEEILYINLCKIWLKKKHGRTSYCNILNYKSRFLFQI
jgi:hypothetical protein